MTPTSKLRFVVRYEPTPIKVLQQWFEDRGIRLAVMKHDKYGIPIPCYQGEWRDIPLETEND